jgi:integrase
MNYSSLKFNQKKLYVTWYEYFIEVKHEIMNKTMNNEPTQRQIKAHIPWEDIIKIRDELPYGSMEHLLMSMYTMIPPRRQWDYMCVRLYTSEKFRAKNTHNYIHLGHPSGAYIQLSDYKTAKYTKNWWKPLPEELIAVIQASLKFKKRNHLFVKRNGEPYDSLETFTSWTNGVIKRVLKNKNASVNTLRHSFETYLDANDIPWEQRNQYAKDMGHSLLQAFQYQLKISKKDVDDVKVEKCFQKDEGGKEKEVDCLIIKDKSNMSKKRLKLKQKIAQLLKKSKTP